MIAVVASSDVFLSEKLANIAREAGFRVLRSSKVERIIKELKQPDRIAIVDLAWEDAQARGVLKQMVNIGRISGNKVICMCPNQDEDLKKLAKAARAEKVFIRHDLEGLFKDYMNEK